MRSASIRARDAWLSIRRMAKRVSDEMDEATNPDGVRVAGFTDEDSMVTAVADLISSVKPKD